MIILSILTILKNKSSLSISFKAGKRIIINNKKQTDKNKTKIHWQTIPYIGL